jgi:hypothetical protein
MINKGILYCSTCEAPIRTSLCTECKTMYMCDCYMDQWCRYKTLTEMRYIINDMKQLI